MLTSSWIRLSGTGSAARWHTRSAGHLDRADRRSKVLVEGLQRTAQPWRHDILIAVVDGLKGLAEAIEAAFPQTTVQTCIVHLIRNSLDYASWKDRKAIASALRPIVCFRQGCMNF
jgi:transposase-like protein